MRKLVTVATVLSLVSLLLVPAAFAQAGTSPGTPRDPAPSRPSETPPSTMPSERPRTSPSTTMGSASELYASNLIGADVKTPQGETIGEIKELILDPREAKIKTAVVSVGGVLGLGAKTVAIPWEKVTLQPDGKDVIVAMGKEEFQNAPEWRKADDRPAAPAREPATSPRPGAAR